MLKPKNNVFAVTKPIRLVNLYLLNWTRVSPFRHVICGFEDRGFVAQFTEESGTHAGKVDDRLH